LTRAYLCVIMSTLRECKNKIKDIYFRVYFARGVVIPQKCRRAYPSST